MKSNYLRSCAALLLALSLAACGGKSSFTISGVFTTSDLVTLQPLNNSGLVLENSNNGDTVSVPAGATSFTFPKQVDYGEVYTIVVKTPPNHMTCTPQFPSNTDSAGHTTSIKVIVECAQNQYLIGGTVNGLPTTATTLPLILINGSNNSPYTYDPTLTTDPIPPLFVMPSQVLDGATYGVTVLQNPTGYACTVANGNGVVNGGTVATGTEVVTNIAVNCVPSP
jgi:hypothetical protein